MTDSSETLPALSTSKSPMTFTIVPKFRSNCRPEKLATATLAGMPTRETDVRSILAATNTPTSTSPVTWAVVPAAGVGRLCPFCRIVVTSVATRMATLRSFISMPTPLPVLVTCGVSEAGLSTCQYGPPMPSNA